MQITINGKPVLTETSDLKETLKNWGAEPPYSIAINQQFIPKHLWADTRLRLNDAIEILTPISGG